MKRAEIIAEIEERIEAIESSFGFNNSIGSVQTIGKSRGVILEYGRYAELIDLYELILDCTYISKNIKLN